MESPVVGVRPLPATQINSFLVGNSTFVFHLTSEANTGLSVTFMCVLVVVRLLLVCIYGL